MNNNEIVSQYIASLEPVINIDVVYGSRSEILMRGTPNDLMLLSEMDILNRISNLPGNSEIVMMEPNVVIKLKLPGKISNIKIPWLNIVLFVLTLISTLLVGAGSVGVDFISHPEIIWQEPLRIISAGGSFAFSLIAILLFHEFGHYIASRIHGANVTLPYFIPFPNFVGTMGAVIRIKSPFVTRKQLFDVGAAGPISGMVVAIPLAIWGLSNPIYIPEVLNTPGLINLGDSLLYSLITHLVQPSPPDGYMAVITPMAFAARVGFLITMLNLLPIGQLDGGHIVYAMFGKFQVKIAYVMIAGLLILSYFWLGWLIWALLSVIIVKPKHPPTVMDEIPLDNKRMIIGFITIAIFILCFIPIPISEF